MHIKLSLFSVEKIFMKNFYKANYSNYKTSTISSVNFSINKYTNSVLLVASCSEQIVRISDYSFSIIFTVYIQAQYTLFEEMVLHLPSLLGLSVLFIFTHQVHEG